MHTLSFLCWRSLDQQGLFFDANLQAGANGLAHSVHKQKEATLTKQGRNPKRKSRSMNGLR